MPQCAVATCRNSHRRTRGRRIRYHRFPQIPEVRSRWVRACGRTPLANGDIPFNIQTARICSLHFSNDSYEKDMEHLVLGLPVRSRLRRGAVPTVGVPVAVQPVTKMLVEDAKRTLLKQAHLKMMSEKKAKNGGLSKAQQKKLMEMEMMRAETPKTPTDKEMTGIDVLLALGLKPTAHLNKMHATEAPDLGAKPEDSSAVTIVDGQTPAEVPQKQQNGAALPEETASIAASCSPTKPKIEVKEQLPEAASTVPKSPTDRQPPPPSHKPSSQELVPRKRRLAPDLGISSVKPNGLMPAKKMCFFEQKEQREQFINVLIGASADKFVTVEQLTARAEQLRSDVHDLDELARVKEMEWNEILSMRKLKEEAYLRIERRRQIMSFMESNGETGIPPASMSLGPQVAWEGKQEQLEPAIQAAAYHRRENHTKSVKNNNYGRSNHHQQQLANYHAKQIQENGSSKHAADAQDQRLVGEGRQGPQVDVKSIIADYRLAHPEAIPKRRGRRTRNSVNIGLGAGGAMLENIAALDSRPSSTDSCKSGTNLPEPNQAMSFKDVLVQFAKLSQQQVDTSTNNTKMPQNYPDVTLHPVGGLTQSQSQQPQNAIPQASGSLLHGILTKSQSPRPSTFSPTLARLLTAPERERHASALMSNHHHQSSTATNNLLQTYQSNSSNPGVAITDYLQSSKGRTEITITPVVNTAIQNHPNNLINIDDNDDEASIIEDRLVTRDTREDRETPPRCQGCQDRTAQFVCAGCGNQWYCSRDCQVAAWEDHSEVCSG